MDKAADKNQVVAMHVSPGPTQARYQWQGQRAAVYPVFVPFE
jgi:hypothetical protein